MKRVFLFFGRAFGAGLLAQALCTPVSSASAGEYVVQQGDAIEISVAGLPDLHRRAIVGLGGEVTLPLIGEVKAAGLTVPELRAQIRQSFERQAHRARGAGNAEDIILATEVMVDIAEYRPIYVTGAVLAPGAQAFRPGMSVRQAIALAGGVGRPGVNNVSTQMKIAALTGQQSALTVEVDRQMALLGRLESELADLDGSSSKSRRPEVPKSSMRETEQKLKAERAADLALETAALKRRIQQASARLSQIEQELKNEERAQQADERELQKMEALVAKGLATTPRLVEARRFLLMSATRSLQTSVQAESARREIADLQDKLERLPQQRRIQLLSDIQEARGKADVLRANLDAVTEQLAATATSAPGADRSILTLTRRSGAEAVVSPSQEEALEPGDVLAVTFAQDPARGS